MQESLLMLSEAMRAGITSIVCTPRCCDPWFDFSRMWQAYLQLKRHASAIPGAPELSMGFEVDYHKLKKLGMDAAVQLGNDQGEFLLELPQGTLPTRSDAVKSRRISMLHAVSFRLAVNCKYLRTVYTGAFWILRAVRRRSWCRPAWFAIWPAMLATLPTTSCLPKRWIISDALPILGLWKTRA